MERSLSQESGDLGLGLELGPPEPTSYLPEPWLHQLGKTSWSYCEAITEVQLPSK